jgi:peptidoglycan/LPS O-acetylase OafA/YrhL
MVWPFDVNIQGLRAVDMFFMISGFVILVTLERTRSAADFVMARFGRLYPAYWLCLTLTTLTIVLIPQPVQSISTAQVLANFTMFNLYFGYLPIGSVYWSLAVECAFYGIMATVFALRWLPHIEALGAIWTLLSALLFTVFPSAGAMLPWRVQTMTILPYAPLFYAGILFFRRISGGRPRYVSDCLPRAC